VSAPLRFRWTLRRSLAAAAFALGALAMAGNPVRGHVVTIDTQELATIVGGQVDHVMPAELADWIVRGAADYRLVDLRDEAGFAQYHIPTAENVPIARLPDHGLGRNERIVLYSEGGIHSAQAWMLLRAQGYTSVSMLKGGLDAWKDQVVFPVLADNAAAAERARDERLRSISAFFGGQPRSAAAVAAGANAMPGVAAPATPLLPKAVAPPSPPGGAKAAPAKKKKEGC
jgi:rhodanese-related sulfurtransferase